MGKKITPEIDKQISLLYVDRELTITNIAKILKVSTFAIRSSLIRQGIKIRGRQETIQRLFDKGILQSPMVGKKHKKESKLKIANSVHSTWENKTDQEKAEYGKLRSEIFTKIPDNIKKEMRVKSAQSLRKTTKEGSRLEKFLLGELRKANYKVVFHGKFLKNSNLEVDLFLPEIGICIEVDGPSHYRDIYEDGTHNKVVKADNEKNGLVTTSGLIMIRIKNDFRSLSNTICREIFEKLSNKLKEIQENRPSIENSLIYI